MQWSRKTGIKDATIRMRLDKYGYSNESKSSYLIIFINYILITIFTPIYGPNTLYLGFCIVLLTLVSVIYLMIDLTKLNKKLIFLLIPYLLWLMTALGLSLSLYLLN
jgi:tryptophan-rich sensory protein